MTTPRDPQQPHDVSEQDRGADYDAFLSEAARALEPTAADAARVRAQLDASLAAPPTAGPSAGGTGASPALLGLTVRWVGLAVVTLALVGGVALRLNDAGSSPSATASAPSAGLPPVEPPGQAPGTASATREAGGSSVGSRDRPERSGGEVAEASQAHVGAGRAAAALPADVDGAGLGAGAGQGGSAPAAADRARPAQADRTRSSWDTSGRREGRAASTEDATETGNPPAAEGEATHVAPPPSLLAREAARLLRARNALSSGQAGEALSLTTRLPEGDPLSPERRAIRVRALCALGRVGEARQVAGTLGDGNGPSAAAVRASCVGERAHP